MDGLLESVPYPPIGLDLRDSEKAERVHPLCQSLHTETTNLQSSIALFDHASALSENIRHVSHIQRTPELERDERITRNWPFMAAREALGAIYNFNWAIKELADIAEDGEVAPRLKSPKGLTAAYEEFERAFNKAILARHAASHRSEIKGNPEKNAHRAALSSGVIQKPKHAMLSMSDCLIGRTYTGTRKGEILKFDVTWESYSIALRIYKSAISSVAEDPWRLQGND